jgi:hypothetical protein
MKLPLNKKPLDKKNSDKPVSKVKTREYTDSAKYSQAKKSYGDSLSLYNKTKDVENPKNYNVTPKPGVNLFGKTFKEKAKLNNFIKKNNIKPYDTPMEKYPGKIKPVNTKIFTEGLAYPVYKKPVELPTYKPVKKEQVKPVPQKPELKKPEVKKPSGEVDFKQGRKFMRETGLRPGFYKKEDLAENSNKKIPIKRR